jgi:hypothetical protein
MPSRYDRPVSKPPSRDDLAYYLRNAEPTMAERGENPGAREKDRVDGVDALRQIGRDFVREANAKKPPPPGYSCLRAMPVELREFLEINGLRILLADDPYDALEQFLGQGPPRVKKHRRNKGRHAEDNERRDISIAADVAELINAGNTIEDACKTIGGPIGPAPVGQEMVRKIYLALRHTDAVKAELCFRKLTKQSPAG